jgi:hypothetical protein
MVEELPPYFFRVRENGVAVFRVDGASRSRRLEFEQIAVAHVKTGEIKPQGGRELTGADRAAIEGWLAERRAVLAAREMDEVWRCVDQLNLTAQWAQARAAPEQLEAVTDALLLAMHDLRAVLVRRKADRLARSGEGGAGGAGG